MNNNKVRIDTTLTFGSWALAAAMVAGAGAAHAAPWGNNFPRGGPPAPPAQGAAPAAAPAQSTAPAAAPAQGAAPVQSDYDKAKADLTTTINSYNSQAALLTSMNQAYASYQWAQPYLETAPGNGAWAQIAMSNGDAERIVGIALSRCGADDSATTQRVSTALGASASSSYAQSRAVFCQALQAASQMLYRYSVYQNYKVNGYKIAEKMAKTEFRFDGKYHRTVQMGATFMYYPDLWDTTTNGFSVEDRLQYNSWFKFSDYDREDLNIIEKLRTQGGAAGVCIPLVKGGGVSASVCMANMVATPSSVAVDMSAKLSWSGENKTISMGRVTLPAPFGYLDEVAQMKDSAKQSMMNNLKSQVVKVMDIDSQTQAKLQTLQTIVAQMPVR